jgi:hypothetical protein
VPEHVQPYPHFYPSAANNRAHVLMRAKCLKRTGIRNSKSLKLVICDAGGNFRDAAGK